MQEIKSDFRLAKPINYSDKGVSAPENQAFIHNKTKENTVAHGGYRFLNPYNFVRNLPKQDEGFFAIKIPPTHEIYGVEKDQPEGSLTGYLDCEIKVITPLFISSGKPVNGQEHPEHAFFNIGREDTRKVIPGSSLRGMVRSIYETVTDSCYAIFNDVTLSWKMCARRQMYEHSLGELLPEHLRPCLNYRELCPACRLFGWLKGQDNGTKAKDRPENMAYAGRVSFGQAELVNEVKGERNVVLAELASPRPTTTFFYLLDKNDQSKFVSKAAGFNPKEQQLRGRKFYWHHNSFAWQRGEPTKRNRTIIDPVYPGSTFKFRIRYENLLPEELGALIWSVQLDKDMYHRLGFAKPLGLGSVTIKIIEGFYFDFDKRYSSLNSDGRERIELSYYIDEFKKTFAAAFKIKYEDSDTIKDLSAILKGHPKWPIHYPRLKRQHELRGDENFRWFLKPSKEKTLGLASEDKGLTI